MKKFIVCLLTGFLFLTFTSTQLAAATKPTLPPSDPTMTVQSAQANALMLRLDEIKALDKSNLTSSEKKKLRKETRSIKSELKALSGGVYISAGALILILILLVVLL